MCSHEKGCSTRMRNCYRSSTDLCRGCMDRDQDSQQGERSYGTEYCYQTLHEEQQCMNHEKLEEIDHCAKYYLPIIKSHEDRKLLDMNNYD